MDGLVKRLLFVIFLLFLWTLPAQGERSAASPVERFHALLLDAMKGGEELGFEGRYALLEGGLDESFDMEFMARSALGGGWKKLGEAERASFVELSRRLSATRYADNFDGYGGQRFETRSEAPGGRGTVFVKTELIQLEDDPVAFDYRLRRVDGEWRIIDVLLDGRISEIALRRAQFRSILDKQGFAGLVEAIEEKIAEFARE